MVLNPQLISISTACTVNCKTYESNPTPNPLTMRPNSIISYPVVKVWIAPPRAKRTAPVNNVIRRPIMSPTRPARIEVTTNRTVA